MFRADGSLKRSLSRGAVSADDIESILNGLLSPAARADFYRGREADFSFDIDAGESGNRRFRANLAFEQGRPTIVIRIIPKDIKSISELKLPAMLTDIAKKSSGLFLATGPSGSGKSTTLAAIVQEINAARAANIITIEDPIEYVYKPRKAIIRQREVGSDTLSFAEAVKRAMRQDPDVILIGELRDFETASAAVAAAETGHLVLTTLHTPDASRSIDRIAGAFPPFQQQQIREQLSSTLTGVLSQRLLPMADGTGRIAATEILIVNNAVRNYIREGKTSQIKSVIQTGAALGMHTMEQDIARLYSEGSITYDTLTRARER